MTTSTKLNQADIYPDALVLLQFLLVLVLLQLSAWQYHIYPTLQETAVIITEPMHGHASCRLWAAQPHVQGEHCVLIEPSKDGDPPVQLTEDNGLSQVSWVQQVRGRRAERQRGGSLRALGVQHPGCALLPAGVHYVKTQILLVWEVRRFLGTPLQYENILSI